MKKIFLLILVFLGINLYANNIKKDVITQKDIQEQNKMVQPIEPTPDEKIDDWANKFLQRMGIPSFGEVNGKFFYYAQEPVSLPSTDPQFGKALVNAYDKAMMDIYTRYAEDMYGHTFVKEFRKFFQDSSTNAREIPLPNNYTRGFWGKVLEILNKSLEVIDKKLDKKLEELGVDPSEFKNLTPKAKKDLLRDTFIKKVIIQASGDISGIFTVQSAYASDKNGNYVVGVIAVVTPKTRQIAKDIRLGRKPLIKGRGRDILSLIPKTPQGLAATLGTRLAYDKDGTPVIISYGISSYIPDKDFYVNVRLKQDAISDAIASADAQIAMLVNGFLSEKTQRENGEEIRRYVERELKPNSDTIEKTIKNIISKTFSNAKATASMRLQGITTVKEWRYTMPTGQKLVGAVRVWRYSTLQKVEKFKEGYKPQNKKIKRNLNSDFQESPITNDLNDF